MENSQKNLLIFGGIALLVWCGYRTTSKLPLLPMKPAPEESGAATGSSSFTGYAEMNGDNSMPTIVSM